MRSVCSLIAVVVVLWVSASGRAETRTLQNGLSITPYPTTYPNESYNYYGTQDATISPAQPDANFGRATLTLDAAAGTKVLIQFRELHRAIGPHKQITFASLRLHPVAGAWSLGNSVRVYRLLQPWRQGSMEAVPQPQHWACSWNHRFYSARPGEALTWAAPGAAMAGVDRASAPTVVTTTSANYNASAGTWQINGLGQDVAIFYAAQHRNFGWVIEFDGTPSGENRAHSSESPVVSLRPELIVTYNSITPPARTSDLDVTYISRTPEYYRYNPNAYQYRTFHDESVGLLKSPGFADMPKWPANGDVVTFTAHVRNKGLSGASGPFNYRWMINGQVVATGQEPVGIAAGEEKTFAFNWVWDANDYLGGTDSHRNSLDHRDRWVTFEVDPDDAIADYNRNNNALSQFIEAPCMGIYAEQSMYDMFNAQVNQLGTFSFEDWVNWYVSIWNETYLEMSRFAGFAEDGCLERVRVQKIQIVPDGTLQGGNHIPGGQTNFLIDGEWGMLPDQAYVDKFSKILEWAWLHECTHQMGMIDLYSMNMESGTPVAPSRVKVKDGGTTYITRGYYPSFMGLMAGDDTRFNPSYEPTGLLEDWTCGALNSNCGYRRGFYGEMLYDVPDVARLRAVDATGSPLPFAEFKIWQSSGGQTSETNNSGVPYPWQPIFEGQADADGVVTLPNINTLENGPFTTYTGHTLKPNPWGRINVVGTNGSFLISVKAQGQKDYAFLRVTEFNKKYWSGHTAEATCDVRVQIAPVALGDNIALGRTATASSGSGAAYLVDGNPNTRWDGGNSPVGTWIQVDLGSNRTFAAVDLFQNGYGGDFFQKFRIEASTTSAFTGEQTLFARESVSWNRASSDRRDMDPADPDLDAFTVRYAGAPTTARYVRITCEEAHWSKLAELRIYESQGATPPTAQSVSVDVAVNSYAEFVLPGVSAYALPLSTTIVSLPAEGVLADPATGLPITTVPYTLTGGGNVVRYVSRPAARYDESFEFKVNDGVDSAPAVASVRVGGIELIYRFDLDSDPGWTRQGAWAFGVPQGGGGSHGYPDPVSGFTGQNVFGYNLAGDYTSNLPERHLTSTPLDCTGITQTRLRFYRWLGVEGNGFDNAYVRVSNNGSSFTTLWQATSEVADNAWVPQEFDISAVADNRPTVYLRWTMGTTDANWQYCGWNIDDIEIWGVGPLPPPLVGDMDHDHDVDMEDFGAFQICLSGGQAVVDPACLEARLDGDLDVDQADVEIFIACAAGPGEPPVEGCRE
ncbi:MAG TPA: discoidin domain-containing protein [Phycisphaerae bacterium]|nr:discoidin domain-containing protein [Phycisphaerae bacterium]